MVPFGDQKGTRWRKADAVAAPATVSGKTTPLVITGQPGRSASVVDPRARRPAIARAADLGRGDRWFVSFAASPAIVLFSPNSMRGCHDWNRLKSPKRGRR